jgi:hypothetical protein
VQRDTVPHVIVIDRLDGLLASASEISIVSIIGFNFFSLASFSMASTSFLLPMWLPEMLDPFSAKPEALACIN